MKISDLILIIIAAVIIITWAWLINYQVIGPAIEAHIDQDDLPMFLKNCNE